MTRNARILIVLALVLAAGGGAYYFLVLGKEDSTSTGSFEIAQPKDPSETSGADGEAADSTASGSGGSGDAGSSADSTGAAGTIDAAAADASSAESVATTKAAPRAAADGTNQGNNAEALLTSQSVAKIGTKSKLAFAVQTMLQPAAGGVAKAAALAKYRKAVTAAALRIEIADSTSQTEWDKGTKAIKEKFVTSFLGYLSRRYPSANVSVTIVDSASTVLAVGDDAGKPHVSIYG